MLEEKVQFVVYSIEVYWKILARLRDKKPVQIITGNGPLLAIASQRRIYLFVFDEHHGWNPVASQTVESNIDHLRVDFTGTVLEASKIVPS